MGDAAVLHYQPARVRPKIDALPVARCLLGVAAFEENRIGDGTSGIQPAADIDPAGGVDTHSRRDGKRGALCNGEVAGEVVRNSHFGGKLNRSLSFRTMIVLDYRVVCGVVADTDVRGVVVPLSWPGPEGLSKR